MARRAGSRTEAGKSSTASALPPSLKRLKQWRRQRRRQRLCGIFSVALCLLLFAWAAAPGRADERTAEQILAKEAPRLPFIDGVAAFDRGEYAVARKIWLPHAHRGDPAAQRNLAHLYRMGLGVPQDFVQAASWYRLAADSGLARAQANLATMYLRGQGVAEDPREAAFWFTAAAYNGHALAQFNLALLYLRGEGVERSEAKAAGWLYLASKTGHKPALRALGKLVKVISGPAGPPSPPNPPGAAKPRTPVAEKSKPVARTKLAAAPPMPKASTTAKTEAAVIVPQVSKPETVKIQPVKIKPAKITTAKSQPAAAAEADETGSDISFAEIVAFFSGQEELDLSRDRDDTGNIHQENAKVEESEEDVARRDMAAGLVALHAANFATAKARWQPLARNGRAEAQYQLGRLYLRNGFAEVSRPYGFYWLSRAAAQGHAGAKSDKNQLANVMSPEEHLTARQLLQEAE
jgi:uncharacterized protein